MDIDDFAIERLLVIRHMQTHSTVWEATPLDVGKHNDSWVARGAATVNEAGDTYTAITCHFFPHRDQAEKYVSATDPFWNDTVIR